MTRGERNNNPLNIRRTKSHWLGMKDEVKDTAFCEFKTLPWGFRAAFKLLQIYYTKYKRCTLEQIITRWAPPSENNTSGYIQQVVKQTSLNPRQLLPHPLKVKSTWVDIVLAMAYVECAKHFPRTVAEAGYDLSVEK